MVTPGMSCIIGIIAGWMYLGFSKFLVKLRINNAVDAVPVHFACEIWGVLAVGLLAEPTLTANVYGDGAGCGAFYKGCGGDQLINKITLIAWIIGWVTVTMTPFFHVLKGAGMLRRLPISEKER